MGGLVDRIIRQPGQPRLRFDRPVARPPALVLCPAPATADWPSLAQDDVLRGFGASGFQLYQLHLTPESQHVTQGPNTLEFLRETALLEAVGRVGLELHVEVPALKPWSSDPVVYTQQSLTCLASARELGRPAAVLVMDEPGYAGLRLCEPRWAIGDILAHVTTYMETVRAEAPALGFCLAEPYPALSGWTILQLVRVLPGIAALRVDVDYNHARQLGIDRLRLDLLAMQRECQATSVAFEVIVWGCDESSNEAWVTSAERLLAAFQWTFGVNWPDRVIVQSWSPAREEPRIMPPTLLARHSLENVWQTTRRMLGT